MVLSLDTDVDTSPDPSSGFAASTAVSPTSSQSKLEDTARLFLPSSQLKGMIYM